MSLLFFRVCLVITCAAVGLATIGCSSESTQEMLERALSDASISDSDAVELVAKAILDTAEVSGEVASDGKVLATISVHGEDESGLPPSVIDTAEGGINNAMKHIQLALFIEDFARFVENGRQRNLGEVVLTIKTATFSDGQLDDWVDTYRLRLSSDRFDQFLQVAQFDDWDKRVATAERTWTVEFDVFDQFTYQE